VTIADLALKNMSKNEGMIFSAAKFPNRSK